MMWPDRALLTAVLTRTGIVSGLVLLALTGGRRVAHADSWAVLIGVSEYRYRNQITPLGGAANDARALRRILHERLRVPEDHIQLLIAEAGRKPTGDESVPDRSEIVSALERLRYSVKPDDTIWLFFAGHGVSVKGQTYLLPYDASNLSDVSLVNTALRVDEIKSALNAIPAHARILMFDMCRSEPRAGSRDVGAANPLTPGIVRSLDFTPPAPTVQKPTKPPITITLFACSPGQRSYEWENKGRGFFSYYLEEGLGGKAANKQHQVTVDGLAYYVRTQVRQAVATRLNRAQVPLSALGGPGAASYVVTTVAPGSVAWIPGGAAPAANGATTNPGTGGGTVPDTANNGNSGGAASTGGITTPGGAPLPALDSQSARVEFYTNDPTISAVINGAAVTSGGARTEPVPAGTPRTFRYQGRVAESLLPTQYLSPLAQGEASAFLLIKTHNGLLNIKSWPPFSTFAQLPLVVGSGDEKAAHKGISAGAWELGDCKTRVADQFTQTLYPSRRSIASGDPAHPDTDQQLVIVEGTLRNKSKEKRYWYALRVEGGETVFPYDESALTDRSDAVYPLIAQDADPGGDLKWKFEAGEKRPVRWIFRMPKTMSLKDVARVRLTLLWISDEQQLQRAQFVIRRK